MDLWHICLPIVELMLIRYLEINIGFNNFFASIDMLKLLAVLTNVCQSLPTFVQCLLMFTIVCQYLLIFNQYSQVLTDGFTNVWSQHCQSMLAFWALKVQCLIYLLFYFNNILSVLHTFSSLSFSLSPSFPLFLSLSHTHSLTLFLKHTHTHLLLRSGFEWRSFSKLKKEF